MQTVTIKIIRESTGETVSSQEYISPTTVFVNLTLQNSSIYYIEISSDDTCLQGKFIL